MYISHLSLTNFRIVKELALDLPPGPVVLVGPNAQGKTTILEAIYLLAISRSFRAENEREVVSWNTATEQSLTLVSGTIERRNDRQRVVVGYQCVPVTGGAQEGGYSIRKQITVSRIRRTAAELVGLVNAVLFSADDLGLVQGPPAGRRRYLDILLSQVDQTYLRALQGYQKVLHQRNQLLKLIQEKRAGLDELAFWDDSLISEGSLILLERYKALDHLRSLSSELQLELTGHAEDLQLDYKSTVQSPSYPFLSENRGQMGIDGVEEAFRIALEQSKRRERALGSTVVGPHRDDLKLTVAGIDMSTYASRGQARTIALTLRLAEASYLALHKGEVPIVLLDDVLSELDSNRRAQVLDKTKGYQQVVISCTDLEPLGEEFLARATCYKVTRGQISPL